MKVYRILDEGLVGEGTKEGIRDTVGNIYRNYTPSTTEAEEP